MSLHAILEAIRSAGEEKVGEIESRSYSQVHEILASAQLEAEQLKERTRATTLEPASHERARLTHRARLEAMQTIGSTRKELVDAALEQVRGRLANLRTDACYPKVMRQLVLEALAELNGSQQVAGMALPGEPVNLQADPADQALLEGVLNTLNLDLPVSYCLKCWGGVVATSENGRIVVINTLEARLERAIPHLRRYLAAFFESERSEIGFKQPVVFQMAKEP